MKPRIIRSLEDRVDLVQEGEDIFWRQNRKRAGPKQQKQLFAEYNPALAEKLTRLKAYEGESMLQGTLIEILDSNRNQLRNYLFNNPNLHPKKRKPISMKSVYAILVDFMPPIEGWSTSVEIIRDLGISRACVDDHCHNNLIENKYFLDRYWISPEGVDKLKELLKIKNSNLKEWKTTGEAATTLGIGKSTIIHYCLTDENVCAKKYKRNWRIPLEGINYLRNITKKMQSSFEFNRKTYVPLEDTAKETALMRGHKDPEYAKQMLARFHGLLKLRDIPFVIERRVHYTDKETSEFLMNLMMQWEAREILSLDRHTLRDYMDEGKLDNVPLGKRAWTTYSSVMRVKAEQATPAS